MTLGMKFFIIQIATVVLYETSNIIIAQLYGPEQVTPYNVTYKYFGIIPMIMGIIMTPFWSAFTEAWVKKDTHWIKTTMKRLQYLWLLLTIITLIMLVLSNVVYKLWVGKEINVPFSISVAMASYVIINAWNGIYSQFLNGVGKIKLQLYTAMAGTIINIPLALFLGKSLGIYGVVLSTTIISITSVIVSPIQYNRIINNNARGIWAK
jgi:O-antigen/teichoic acid export membrane protein